MTKANIRPLCLLSFNLFVIAPRLLAKKTNYISCVKFSCFFFFFIRLLLHGSAKRKQELRNYSETK